MKTPSWELAPSWAQYLAQDENGMWYWFQSEPEKRATTWMVTSGKTMARITMATPDHEPLTPNPSWRGTLQARAHYQFIQELQEFSQVQMHLDTDSGHPAQ